MVVTLSAEPFGSHKGQAVIKYTWTTDSGFSVSAISYGAIIQSVKVPDKNGVVKDVTLGFDNLVGYEANPGPYFGAAMGRCANRIGGATFEIDGQSYNLSKNERNKTHLHGGSLGVSQKAWLSETKGTEVIFSTLSPHGDEGYPGDVIMSISYDVREDGTLRMVYTAATNKKTIVNLANHAYFNLAGHDTGAETLREHFVSINADKITDTDVDQIPTGGFIEVGGTRYDFRSSTNLGDALKKGNFDNNYCVSKHGNKGMTFVSRVVHPQSGRYLEVHSDQPGVQFYSSNNLPDAPKEQPIQGKGGAGYIKYGAFCLETQNYPDAIHHSNFPSPILKPGDFYTHEAIYKFGAEK